MGLFVFETESCRRGASTHGLAVDVERLIERVESAQSLSMFDPFPPPYLVKKKIGGRQGRLIAEVRVFGEHTVVILLAVLIRGNRAYEDEFAKDPSAYGKQHLNDLVTTADIEAFLAERTALSETQAKPEPSESEYAMLYDAFAHQSGHVADDLVCETPMWVQQVTQERISKQLVLLSAPCLSALERAPGLWYVEAPQKVNWGIWAYRSQGRLLLLAVSTDANVAEAEAHARKVVATLDGQDASAVLRVSQRAYPAIVLADDDLWLDLEREPVANMALSPEESSVLESARQSAHAFPLFINGRAGSGKSTILQYLFADLLFYYLREPNAKTIAPPLYLTANGELLRNARNFVERLLRSEATFTQQLKGDVVNDSRAILDTAFREFQPFLLSLLPAEERRARFNGAARVDYPRFRRMWTERFGKERKALREYGPDLSWHVIRSYIKGMSSETFLEPDEYALLPENQITVTHETFQLVYERVWENWYERIFDAEGLWDDQDLTRFVLDHDLVRSVHPVVFCDEAQDFTRLELEMLLRLSLFSNRTLPSNDVARVPFAFAGDQFQTLNPTGFRWDAIKAAFVEKFIYELNPARRTGKADLNYQELKFNYRSTHKIVRFSNHVQALRAALFGLPDLTPQRPWTKDDSAPQVVWFRSNDASFWNKFREDTSFVVIVPCNDGEESAFVQEDPVLKQHVLIEDGVPRNVLSASRAKGCEYANVVVYGFGAAAMVDVTARFGKERIEGAIVDNPDQSLPLQYFINRLYVAVSRAKRRLVIVDSDSGFGMLWRCALDELAERDMLACAKNGPAVWGNDIEGMVAGTASDVSRDIAADPRETARTFEADGIARRDSFLLRQAALSYRAANDQAKARECRARAFEADGDDFEAGTDYLEAGFVPDGMRCLWRAGRRGWAQLCDAPSQHPQLVNELEVVWAGTICGKPSLDRTADLLRRFVHRLGSDPRFAGEAVGQNVWREAVDALIRPLMDVRSSAVTPEVANELIDALEQIQSYGIGLPDRIYAQVCFLGKRYSKAITLWDKAGDTRTPSYFDAKAASEPYPQSIDWHLKLGRTEGLLAAFDEARDVMLTEEQASAIVDLLFVAKRFREALALGWSTPGASRLLLSLALRFLRTQHSALATQALLLGVRRIAESNNWDGISSFLTTGEFTPGKDWKDKVVRAWLKSQLDDMRIVLVQVFARSDHLAEAPIHRQQVVSSFLRDYLRVKDGRWRKQVTFAEAGAAYERTGRYTDAIAYYEAVLRERLTREDEQFARSRWFVAKLRQLDHERSHGSAERAAQIENQVHAKQADWHISTLSAASTFPELSPVAAPVILDPGSLTPSTTGSAQVVSGTPQLAPVELANDQPVVMTLGSFRIEIGRGRQRCNITDTDSLETAHVRVKEGVVGGEGDFALGSDGRWTSQAWGLTVSLCPTPEVLITFSVERLGIKASVNV